MGISPKRVKNDTLKRSWVWYHIKFYIKPISSKWRMVEDILRVSYQVFVECETSTKGIPNYQSPSFIIRGSSPSSSARKCLLSLVLKKKERNHWLKSEPINCYWMLRWLVSGPSVHVASRITSRRAGMPFIITWIVATMWHYPHQLLWPTYLNVNTIFCRSS